MSQWQKLFEYLKFKKFDIYSPEQKIGQCKSPYIILKNGGEVKRLDCSTNDSTYTIFCYVPRDMYSYLEEYVIQVKDAMRELFPKFIPSGLETSSFYEEDIKAHMVSIEYINHKKIQRRL